MGEAERLAVQPSGPAHTHLLSALVTPAKFANTVRILSDLWYRETVDVSSPTIIFAHPAYLALESLVVRFPQLAIPFMLREVRADHHYWIGLLHRLTGA